METNIERNDLRITHSTADTTLKRHANARAEKHIAVLIFHLPADPYYRETSFAVHVGRNATGSFNPDAQYSAIGSYC